MEIKRTTSIIDYKDVISCLTVEDQVIYGEMASRIERSKYQEENDITFIVLKGTNEEIDNLLKRLMY